jgi:hypothetical protein
MAPVLLCDNNQPLTAGRVSGGVGTGSSSGVCRRQRWLFTSQQLRLSLAEMGVYEAHVAAQDIDEDYFENIS